MSDRSVEDNPRERWSDRVNGWKKWPAWFWHHKLYRDFWLIGVTVAVLLGFQAISDSRYETLVRSCEETNERHDNTVAALDEAISNIDDPEEQSEAQQSRDFTVFLIDQLAPLTEDCEERATRLLEGG